MRNRAQSSTSYPNQFLLVLSIDHITGATGKTPTVTLSKNGAAYGAAAGAVTELSGGVYSLAGNATDRNTLGELWAHITATGCDTVDVLLCDIVTVDVFAANGGLANVTADVAKWNGTTVATPATAGIPDVNAKNINNVATTSVTTINANQGTTQPVNFTGTGASALAKSDMVDIAGTASQGTAGYVAPDWAHINAPTTTVDLSGTTIKNVDNAIANVTTVATVTNLTNAPTNGDLTATMKTSVTTAATAATPSVTVSDKTGFSLSSAGIQAIWDKLTSALSTVGSIGKLLVDDIDATISSRTKPADTQAAVTLVTTTTNLTNAPTAGDFTSTMKTSLNSATPASVVGAVGSVAGNIGGNVVGSVGSVTADVGITQAAADKVWNTASRTLTSFGTLIADVWSYATRILTAGTNIALAKGTGLTGLNDISTTQVHTEVVNALTVDTYAEPTTPPGATSTIKDMLNWVKMLGRNKLTQTSTQQKVYADDNTTVVATSTVSDDGTTATRSKAS